MTTPLIYDFDAISSVKDDPIFGEAPIVRLFREYLVAEQHADEIEKTAGWEDPESKAAWRAALDLDGKILATPAIDLPSLAIKAYMTLHDEYRDDNALASGLVAPEDIQEGFRPACSLVRDLSRILPDLLGPLCAAFIAADEEGASANG